MAIQDELIDIVPTNKKSDLDFLDVVRRLIPLGQIWGFRISSQLAIQDVIVGDDAIIQDKVVNLLDGTPIVQDTVTNDSVHRLTSKLGNLLSCFSNELYRFQNKWFDLYKESIPGLSVELLPEWEGIAGLPNECTINYESIPIPERQAYTHAQLTTNHIKGLSEEFLTDYAQVVGYEIEIQEDEEFQQPFIVAPVGIDSFGFSSRIGDRLNAAGQWGVVTIKILSGDTTPDPLARFQCQVEKLQGSHVEIIWEV